MRKSDGEDTLLVLNTMKTILGLCSTEKEALNNATDFIEDNSELFMKYMQSKSESN